MRERRAGLDRIASGTNFLNDRFAGMAGIGSAVPARPPTCTSGNDLAVGRGDTKGGRER